MPKVLKDADFNDGSDTELVMAGDQAGKEAITPESGEGGEKEVVGGEGGEGELTPSGPKYKYKDQGEAEKAEKEATRRMTSATEEASRYRTMVERLTERMPTLENKPQEPQRSKIVKKVLEDIGRIPDTDPEKEFKAADLWAAAQEEIADLKIKDTRQRETTQQETWNYAGGVAKRAGLASDMEMGAFWIVFDSSNIQNVQEKSIWAATQILNFKKDVIEGYKKSLETEEREKGELRVLGGGSRLSPKGGGGGGKEPETLTDSLRMIGKQRTLGGKDFSR